jgi:hypothetical protein
MPESIVSASPVASCLNSNSILGLGPVSAKVTRAGRNICTRINNKRNILNLIIVSPGHGSLYSLNKMTVTLIVHPTFVDRRSVSAPGWKPRSEEMIKEEPASEFKLVLLSYKFHGHYGF